MNKIILAAAMLLVSTHAFAQKQLMEAEQLSIAKNYVLTAGLDAYIDLQIGEIRKNLPMQSSHIEYLAGVTYLKDYKTQILRHVTTPGWADVVAKNSGITADQVRSAMPDLMQEQTVNAACSVEITRFLLQNGLKMKHNYYESDGTFLFATQVTAEDCT